MANKKLLREVLNPADSNLINEWKKFLHSFNNTIYWYPYEEFNFEEIYHPRNSNSLYIVTDEYPHKLIYDFISNAEEVKFYDTGNLNITISDVLELKETIKTTSCFWERALNAEINSLAINKLENKFNKSINNVGIKHLSGRTFNEILNTIRNDDTSKFIGKFFLMNLGLSYENIFDTYKRYVLFIFVDDLYFEDIFIKKLGLICNKI